MKLGETIKQCRNKRGLTQSRLAELADISVSHLCLLEKNKREPSISVVEGIAKALEIPLSVLVFLAAQASEVKEMSVTQFEQLSRNIMELVEESVRQKPLF
jgi:transcriptional regulator with XRE-family HTH domain